MTSTLGNIFSNNRGWISAERLRMILEHVDNEAMVIFAFFVEAFKLAHFGFPPLWLTYIGRREEEEEI